MKKWTIVTACLICGILAALAASVSAESRSDIIVDSTGAFIAANAKDITFYNKTLRNAWFRISNHNWIYWNGTITFKRATDITVTTQRELKGTVWICTKVGWNILMGDYTRDSGYCYITSFNSGVATIPAAKLTPGVEYTMVVQLIDSSNIYQYEKTRGRDVWIKIDDPETFDRVEIFGYGPINMVPFKIVVEE